MVRLSDGRTRLYLLPSEYDMASTASLQWMLAREPGRTAAQSVAAR